MIFRANAGMAGLEIPHNVRGVKAEKAVQGIVNLSLVRTQQIGRDSEFLQLFMGVGCMCIHL